MDKKGATKLLNEISKTCPEVVEGGFYLKEIAPTTSEGEVELRIISQNTKNANRNLQNIASKRKLNLTETDGLLIIY